MNGIFHIMVKKLYRLIRIKYLVFLRLYYKVKNKEWHILLVPPAILDGSFGDDLMVCSYLEYNKMSHITIYSSETIKKSYFNNYQRLEHLSWTKKLKLYKYDEVCILGADNMTGSYGLSNPLFKLNLLSSANRIGIKTSILSFSLKKEMPEIIKKKFNELIPLTKFYLRDPHSFKRAQNILPEENLCEVADLAFLAPSSNVQNPHFIEWCKLQKDQDRLIIGICPNALQANKLKPDEYFNHFSKILRQAQSNFNCAYVFLYHDLRPHYLGKFSDKDLSQKLFEDEKITAKYFLNNIDNGLKMKSFLRNVDFTISGRMHFGISGYSVGKPMIGISYEDKFSGLQKSMGIEPSKSLIDYRELDKLEFILDDFIGELSNYKIAVEKNKARILKIALKNLN